MKKSSKPQANQETTPGFLLKKNPKIAAEASPDPGHSPPSAPDPLPRRYGSGELFLTALDPRRLFAYWDIDITEHPGGATILRVLRLPSTTEQEIEVDFEAGNYYFDVKFAGAEYAVELGYHRAGQWHPIGRSTPITTPSDRMSENEEFSVAKVPVDADLRRVGAPIPAASLAALAARHHEAASLLSRAGSLAEVELFSMMQELMGSDCLARGGASEGNLLEKLQERLSSDTGASWLQRLESAAVGLGLSGSWTFSKEVLTSQAGLEQLSSWLAGVTDTLGSELLSSWAPSASESGLSSFESMTSWSGAALSSWTSGESSSWSGQPENAARAFFLHVNAEVIFYGGTHPDARVTIAGKHVPLNADGTFRFHYLLPDGEFEIPITAVSTDGVETRSAILNFSRNTSRFGEVGASSQPILTEPEGRKG